MQTVIKLLKLKCSMFNVSFENEEKMKNCTPLFERFVYGTVRCTSLSKIRKKPLTAAKKYK